MDQSPAASARDFLTAYADGDGDAMLTLCAPGAVAEYVPWGDEGHNPVTRAIDVWTQYPAAFEGFEMPILQVYEDIAQRTAIIATINRGRQRTDVDGIANAGGVMACPHLFVITLDKAGLIARVQVWCDQVTLYRQLGYPSGFVAERAG